jgi:sugar phosphate isomerase/epimerase
MASLSRDDLIASYVTLMGAPLGMPPRHDFAARVAAAADAGFAGIGLVSHEYVALRERGLSGRELRRIADDHGIQVAEIEVLFGWAYDDERADQAKTLLDTLLEMADVFDPRHLNLVDLPPPTGLPPIAVVAERFGAVCDRAAEHELLVALEFLPRSGIPDVRTAWDVARLADRPNGGILVDAYHYFRGTPDEGALREVPADRVNCIQLDDADAEMVGDYVEDTCTRRRLPGQGSFDVVGLMRALDEMGVDTPVSVELMSPEIQALSVEEAARSAHDATRAVLDAARA